MSTFLEQLHQLPKHGGKWQTNVGLCSVSERCATEQEVTAWWQKFASQLLTGWAQFSDQNILYINECPSSKAGHSGPLLNAEFIIGDSSYQLRPAAQGWIATTITLKESEPGSHLETRSFLAGKEGRCKLTYQVAWKPEKPGAPARPVVSRLIKIER